MSSPVTADLDLRRQEEGLRQYIDRPASSIGEKKIYCYPNLCEAAAFIEKSFLDMGCQPGRQEYQAKGKSFANIEAEITGQDNPQEIVIIGAHYDTARGSPGANDNASGIAASADPCPLVL